MRHRTPISALAGALALAVVLVPNAALGVRHTALAQGGTFLDTFDGDPAHPQAVQLPHWDVAIHNRDPQDNAAMQAQHGADCSAPPATHAISSLDDAVFQCRDHLMTALNGPGYGVIYLTPDQMLDFATGTATVKFDLSTTRTSPRDWVDLWVTPFEGQMELPADDWTPDLQGGPRDSLHIRMDKSGGGGFSIFRGTTIVSGVTTDLNTNFWTGYETFLVPSASRRDTFQLDISSTHVRFGMPTYNFWWIDTDIAPLKFTSGIVQLGHHSYTPEKACETNSPELRCGANTWHWDNVSISPATPFTMIHADQIVLGASNASASFPSAAPDGAHLRFAAMASSMRVSFDGGASWQPAEMQAHTVKSADEHAKSFWTPIPKGATGVTFSGGAWYGRPWSVRDVSVFASDNNSATEAPALDGVPGEEAP